MADNIGNKAAHDYHLDVPAAQEGFYVKGASHCDWGMKARLARIVVGYTYGKPSEPNPETRSCWPLTTATSWAPPPAWSGSTWSSRR